MEFIGSLVYPCGFSAGSLAGNSKLAVGVDAGPFVSPGGPKINWWQVQGVTSPSPYKTAGIRFCNLVTPSAGEAVAKKGQLFKLALVTVDERLTIQGSLCPRWNHLVRKKKKKNTVIARWYSQDDGHHSALLTPSLKQSENMFKFKRILKRKKHIELGSFLTLSACKPLFSNWHCWVLVRGKFKLLIHGLLSFLFLWKGHFGSWYISNWYFGNWYCFYWTRNHQIHDL